MQSTIDPFHLWCGRLRTAAVDNDALLFSVVREEPLPDPSNSDHRVDERARQARLDRDFAVLEGLWSSLPLLAPELDEAPTRGTPEWIHHFARRRLEWCIEHSQPPESWLLTILFDLGPISQRNAYERS